MGVLKSGEDYLERILMLQKQNGSVRAIDIANSMNYSKLKSMFHAVPFSEKMEQPLRFSNIRNYSVLFAVFLNKICFSALLCLFCFCRWCLLFVQLPSVVTVVYHLPGHSAVYADVLSGNESGLVGA